MGDDDSSSSITEDSLPPPQEQRPRTPIADGEDDELEMAIRMSLMECTPEQAAVVASVGSSQPDIDARDALQRAADVQTRFIVEPAHHPVPDASDDILEPEPLEELEIHDAGADVPLRPEDVVG